MVEPDPSEEESPSPLEEAGNRRVIKRYSNRKLYDTKESRYVTLLQIAEMVRAGEDVQIIDNASKEDKTDVTLALIISEELKTKPRGIPLATLKALIRSRGGKILTSLRDGPIGKLIPKDPEPGAESSGSGDDDVTVGKGDTEVSKDGQPGAIRRAIEQWQHTVDERIRMILPDFSVIRELQAEVAKLSERVSDLEQKLRTKQD